METRKFCKIVIVYVIFTGILFILFTLSCNPDNQVQINKNITVFNHFPKDSNLTLKDFIIFDQAVPRSIFMVDSLLFVLSSNKNSKYLFYIYSLKNGKLLSKFLRKGRGPDEAIVIFNAGIYKNTLWAYEPLLKKILTVDIKKIVKTKALILNKYPIKDRCYKLAFIDSLFYACYGNNLSKYKVQIIDLSKNKKVSEFGEFEGFTKTIPIDGLKDVYQAFIYSKPTGDKIVLAYRFTDVIEIYDLKQNNKCIPVQGPDKHQINFKLQQRGVTHFFLKDEKTIKSFISGAVTNKYIYLAYSGQTRKNNWNYAKYIYVYNWEGKPVKRLVLNRNIKAITISKDDKTLYAYDNRGYIVTTDIN